MLRTTPKDWPRRGTVMPLAKPPVADVVADLEAGRLESLADHIRDRNGQVDRQVALAIYDLIRGHKGHIGYRLTTVHHPDRSPNEASATKAAESRMRLAAAVWHYHAIKGEGLQKTAASLAAERFGFSQSALLAGVALYRNDPSFAALSDLLGSMQKPSKAAASGFEASNPED